MEENFLMEEILVFGHKSPDTDSICSSIAMANLRKKQGFNIIPCRLGELNKETKFVLDKVGIKTPKLLKTVSAQITDLNYVEKSTVSTEDSIKEALDLMTKENFSSLPVIDKDGYFKTMLSISDIANTYLEIDYSDLFSKYSTTYENLKEGGIIALNFIVLENTFEALECLKKSKFEDIDISQIIVAKNRKVKDFNMMMSENPIYVISARK